MYHKRVMTALITVGPTMVGKNTHVLLLDQLKQKYEGRCVTEGYIRRGSIVLTNMSRGRQDREGNTTYSVTYGADVIFPAEGMQLQCRAVVITKFGLQARLVVDEGDDDPLNVLVARDHNVDNRVFQGLKPGDVFRVKVLGHKFQYGDKEIVVVADPMPEEAVAATEVQETATATAGGEEDGGRTISLGAGMAFGPRGGDDGSGPGETKSVSINIPEGLDINTGVKTKKRTLKKKILT
jgi:DNA-directed RNA polymerase subunit E'/Rpb7